MLSIISSIDCRCDDDDNTWRWTAGQIHATPVTTAPRAGARVRYAERAGCREGTRLGRMTLIGYGGV